MKTAPFFRHTQHVTGLMSPEPEPERYPYHDDTRCPVGQALKASGHWQYYQPHQPNERRGHCPRCIALGKKEA